MIEGICLIEFILICILTGIVRGQNDIIRRERNRK